MESPSRPPVMCRGGSFSSRKSPWHRWKRLKSAGGGVVAARMCERPNGRTLGNRMAKDVVEQSGRVGYGG